MPKEIEMFLTRLHYVPELFIACSNSRTSRIVQFRYVPELSTIQFWYTFSSRIVTSILGCTRIVREFFFYRLLNDAVSIKYFQLCR